MSAFPSLRFPPYTPPNPPASSPPSMSHSTPTSCCENHPGQAICSCILANYPRVGNLPDGVPPYPPGYLGLSPDATSSIYNSLSNAYNSLKDNPESAAALWRAGIHSSPYYPYESALAGYPYYYGGMDLGASARRKNATRETTATLKAWLYEHRKNPYPTKGEKIMLAIITKMTLTQVSTWFANARRRLKKENKMTWSPRNRNGEDDKDDDDDDDLADDSLEREEKGSLHDDDEGGRRSHKDEKSPDSDVSPSDLSSRKEAANTKPRIWSLAETATSQSPPPPVRRSPEALRSADIHSWLAATNNRAHPYSMANRMLRRPIDAAAFASLTRAPIGLLSVPAYSASTSISPQKPDLNISPTSSKTELQRKEN